MVAGVFFIYRPYGLPFFNAFALGGDILVVAGRILCSTESRCMVGVMAIV